MSNDNQSSALRSLGVGALLSCIGVALVALLAGCATASYSPVPSSIAPLPVTNAVVLAAESQRSTLRTALVAPGDTNLTALTVKTGAQVFILASQPVVKRGKLSLAWNASPDPSVIGYRLYYGTNSGDYYASATLGKVTKATLTGLEEGQRYFVAAKAYDAAGTESVNSNEASGVTAIYVSLTTQCWEVSAFGLLGRTNQIQMSTNLTEWQTVHEWFGNGNSVGVIHTNRVKAWFRVEAK